MLVFRLFTSFVSRQAALLLTFGLVVMAELCVTIEWSLPYCTSQEDGSMYAVSGLPFPYVTSAGFSVEFFFIPYVYALNLLILSLCAYPLLRFVLGKYVSQRGKVAAFLGWTGLVFISIWAIGLIVCISIGMLHPTTSITSSPYGNYFELRPVALRYSVNTRNCTPSKYWFPRGWYAN